MHTLRGVSSLAQIGRALCIHLHRGIGLNPTGIIIFV